MALRSIHVILLCNVALYDLLILPNSQLNNKTFSDDVEMYRTLEISLRRLILQPLLLQTYLVNGAAVKYFVDELKINDHFDALRLV